MKHAGFSDAELRARGWDALVEKLGAWGALRLAMQAERGHGDYSESRHVMLGELSVDELLAKMKARPARASKKRR